MASENSHNGATCNALRDITNTEGRTTCPPAKAQVLAGINNESDRKRRSPFFQDLESYDKGKNEIMHPPYKACRNVKGKARSVMNAKPYDLQFSKGNDKSQGERLVEKLSLRGSSSGQISRLNSEADDSSTGPVPSSNSETEDLSTESDEAKETFGLDVEQFLRHRHPAKGHEEPSFSYHTNLDSSGLNKKKDDVGEILSHEKVQNISLCGICPCSSCIKAAYMWSDLIYQDTRGRLSALKSSRRNAKILEGKILGREKVGETSQSQLKKAQSTESDLLQHWTSLLRRTEDTLLCEIMQTQSRLIEIEKLNDKLKRDLETINSQPRNETDE